MRSELVIGAFVAAFAATALAAGDASAFCRTTTVPPPADRVDDACWTQGAQLYHASTCLPYHLLARDSQVIRNTTVSDALAKAFAAWTAPNASCTPGIVGVELAPVNDTVIASYRAGEVGRNLVGVPDTWTHGNGGVDTLALTTLSFDQTTGAVLDVDMELNPTVSWSFTETPLADGYDFQTTITHEVGHMLGIAHSREASAVMSPQYEIGTQRRQLSPDDASAVCTIYPNRVQRTAAAGTVPATACNLAAGSSDASCQPDITHGCAVSAPRGGESGAAVMGVAAALGLVLARRRRG